MNTKDILKYAAFAVGAYMLYRWAKDAGWLDKITGATAAPDQKAIESAAAAAKKKAEDDAAAGKITADQLTALRAQIDAQTAQLRALAAGAGAGAGTGAGASAGASLSAHAAAIKSDPIGVSSVATWAANNKSSVSWHGQFDYDPVAVARELGLKYNSDVWNYYRAYGGGDVPNIDLFPPGDREYQMTIDEYLQARTREGLGGLGAGLNQLASMQSASPWLI